LFEILTYRTTGATFLTVVAPLTQLEKAAAPGCHSGRVDEKPQGKETSSTGPYGAINRYRLNLLPIR